MQGAANFSGEHNDGIQVGQNTGNIYYNSDGRNMQSKAMTRLRYNANTVEENDKWTQFVQHLANDYSQQKDLVPLRVPGTCEWLLSDPKFHAWQESTDSSLLHVYAGPGCGKSVLAKSLINEQILSQSGTVDVLYYFFVAGQGTQARSTSAVSALLHQIFARHPQKINEYALEKYNAFGQQLFSNLNELWTIFSKAINGSVICVLDALDECDDHDRSRLMSKISSLYSGAIPGVQLKMLVTSRPYPDLDFGPMDHGTAPLTIDADDKSDAIALEINRVIQSKVASTIPKATPEVQDAIVHHLQSSPNRTYLWLSLILEFVKRNVALQGTERKLKALIGQLPPDINTIYETMLQRSTDPTRAMKLISIVMVAERPLALTELKEALELTESHYQQYTDIDTESDEQFKDSIRSLCGLLLSVHNSKVVFLHETVREFLSQKVPDSEGLSWQHSINKLAAETMLATACIRFLALHDFRSPPPWSSDRHRDVPQVYSWWIGQYGFLQHAASYWFIHYSRCEETIFDQTTRVLPMLPGVSGAYDTWLQICLWHAYPSRAQRLRLCCSIAFAMFSSLTPGGIHWTKGRFQRISTEENALPGDVSTEASLPASVQMSSAPYGFSRSPKEVLLAFGISLIELGFGALIVTKDAGSARLQDEGYYILLSLGLKTLQELVMEMGVTYSDIVNTCIMYRFSDSSGTAWDDTLMQNILDQVIEPLYSMYSLLFT